MSNVTEEKKLADVWQSLPIDVQKMVIRSVIDNQLLLLHQPNGFTLGQLSKTDRQRAESYSFPRGVKSIALPIFRSYRASEDQDETLEINRKMVEYVASRVLQLKTGGWSSMSADDPDTIEVAVSIISSRLLMELKGSAISNRTLDLQGSLAHELLSLPILWGKGESERAQCDEQLDSILDCTLSMTLSLEVKEYMRSLI